MHWSYKIIERVEIELFVRIFFSLRESAALHILSTAEERNIDDGYFLG